MDTPFERRMQNLENHPTGHFREACIDVCDTAENAKLWFESNGFTPTAADVVALAALIMQRQHEISFENRATDGEDYDDD